MIELHVEEPEFHTILAALRFYQEHRQYDPAQRSAWIETIATNCGQAVSLDAAGIDRLCQRLNTNTAESDDPV
jgi:hypothetical protein